MHPFTILQLKIQAVLPTGVDLVAEAFDEQNFGSWIATYEGSRGGYRLVWLEMVGVFFSGETGKRHGLTSNHLLRKVMLRVFRKMFKSWRVSKKS